MKYFNPKPKPKEASQFHPTITQEQIVQDSNGVKIVVFADKQIDPIKVNEGLSVSDFSLNILIDNNAVDLLKEQPVLNRSNIAIAGAIQNFEDGTNN